MIGKAPGIEDIFPDKIDRWNFVVGTATETFRLYNYKEIIIPVMEFTEVFSRGLGDETDIVSKEMFTFEDRGGRSLTLRPEGTASVVRAYVENGEYNRLSSSKFFYSGPMFRAERPQKGRLRQFNQFGAEIFGSGDPYYDFEIISMMDTITCSLGISDYKIILNSIGCPDCRKEYLEALKKYYESKTDILCADCKKRLSKNPLRLLDCKVESCAALKKDAPAITDYICASCVDHHNAVKKYLTDASIKFTEDPYLVRGLDYYTKTTFEFVTDKLGGQNAFAAGGRYDNLVEHFGGNKTPAVGFAAGIERILLMIEDLSIEDDSLDVYMVHSGGETLKKAVNISTHLRANGISADLEPEAKGFKSQFKKADRENATFAIIIGEDELKGGNVTVKELATGDQASVTDSDLIDFIMGRID